MLNLENEMLKDFFENTLEGMYFVEDDIIIDCNDTSVKMFGYDNKQEMIGLRPYQLSPKYQLDNSLSFDLDNEIKKITQQKGSYNFLWVHKMKKGKNFIAEISTTLIKFDGRKIICVITRDITENYISKQQLKQSEEKYKQIFNNSNDLLFIRELTHDNKPGKIIEVNDVACNIFGYSRDEILKLSDAEVGSVRLSDHMIKKLKTNGSVIFEDTHESRDGTLRDYEVRAHIFKLSNKFAVFFVAKDVTKRKKREKEIEYLAYTDTFTGLNNRHFVLEKINNLLENRIIKDDTVTIGINIDNFKRINDNLGTLIGDKVLKYLAERLKKISSEKDIISRTSGDEFTIMTSLRCISNSIYNYIMDIINIFNEPIIIINHEIHLSVSIGLLLGINYETNHNANDIIKKVNIAVSEAKKINGNSFVIYSKLLEKRTNEDFLIEQELHKALEKNEFDIHYQPIIDSLTGEIVSCEALLRWSSRLGNISPFRFIPIAENNGIITKIGEWVLKTVCKQNKTWQEKGYKPISVAVNISVIQLEQKGFIEFIENTLKETGLDGKYLELEITESIYIQNIDTIIPVINKINKLGIKWSIDDFGTGYSSLSKLIKLPIHKLKIDRSFIKDICEYENTKSIIPAIIAIGKNLNLNIVAEGVETEEHIKFLMINSCDLLQGYFFSKPVNSEDFEVLLQKVNVKYMRN